MFSAILRFDIVNLQYQTILFCSVYKKLIKCILTEHPKNIFILYPYNDCILSLQCATANPDGQKRALVIGGGIANFTDVAATFSGIIRALKEKVSLCS